MGHRILFVDDEPDLIAATKLYFDDEGYEISAAYDGAEALEALSDADVLPDVVILDVRMSGWDVLRMIRGNKEWRALPVIMLTAAASEADQARGWDLGVDWYHTKPFNPKDLLTIVRRVVQAREMQAAEDEITGNGE